MKPLLTGLLVMVVAMLCGRATASSQETAIFYQERTSSGQGTVDTGSVNWSVVQIAPGGPTPPEPAIRGEVTDLAIGLRFIMTVRRNGDHALPASHLIELIFLVPDDFKGGSVGNVLRFAVKDTEEAAGNPIFAMPAKIANGYFILALENKPAVIAINLAMMSQKGWIDIPVVYTSGQRALLALDKGLTGDRLFNEVIEEWKQRGELLPPASTNGVAPQASAPTQGTLQIGAQPSGGAARPSGQSLLRLLLPPSATRLRILPPEEPSQQVERSTDTARTTSNSMPVPAADLYEGEMQNGSPHGKGVMSFREGDKYVGGLRNGRPDGKGVLDTAEGDRFEGEFKEGRPHGRGTLTTAEGFRYEGIWSDGVEVDVRRVGQRRAIPSTKLTGPAPAIREAEKERAVPTARPATFADEIAGKNQRLVVTIQERLIWLGYEPGDPDGRVGPKTRDAIRAYAGDHLLTPEQMTIDQFVGHVLGHHSYTVLKYRETKNNECRVWTGGRAGLEMTWSGLCIAGYASGQGTLKTEFILRGKRVWTRYEGMMNGGKYSGAGKLSWHGEMPAKGKRYIGNFVDGVFSGQGEIVYGDGRRYNGYFQKGEFHGFGVYSAPNFGRLEGTFVRGQPNGYGKLFDTKGRLSMEGEFRNGCLKVGKQWAYALTTREKCGF